MTFLSLAYIILHHQNTIYYIYDLHKKFIWNTIMNSYKCIL